MASVDELRLAALGRYEILGTLPETRFERLTRLAGNIFGAPIALISLIDEELDRQWFKSHRGLDLCETPLSMSFCTHAIEKPDVMVVPDAKKDDRFRDNPLVTGEPFIRFYAGAPLTLSDGVRIGTLCIIDTLPRTHFSTTDREIITDLAALVVDEMELRRLS